MSIIKELERMGYNTMPADFYTKIKLWKSWYDGKVRNFHNYKVFNGVEKVSCERYSLGMGKKVCEDWANLLMNEKVKITLEGEKEQAFFDNVCENNNFAVKMSEMQEMKSAYGTTAYVPRIVGAEVVGDKVKKASAIEIDYVTADYIYPLSWSNGKITECAFASAANVGGKKYLYLQIHHLVKGVYDIDNVIFEVSGTSCKRANLSDVKGYEHIPAVVHTESENRQFVIDRLNIANNIDVSLPMGIAVFANAIDQLKGVDVAYDSYVNEFVLGKKRIMVKPEAQKSLDGEPVFDANDVAFYVLPEDSKADTFLKEIDMNLRTEEHNKGMQDMLNALSSKCGFGENHYKYENGNLTTATEVISANSTMFRTIKKHEIILESVLVEFCRILLRLGKAYMDSSLNPDVEISIDFDDSIIEDKNAEFNRDRQMLADGTLNGYEFRMKWMNEDEETARAALPKTESLITE